MKTSAAWCLILFLVGSLFATHVLAQGIEMRPQTGNADSTVSVAFNPEGTLMVAGSHNKPPRLWSLAAGRLLRGFEDRGSGVWAVVFSADGQSVIGACNDNTLRMWGISTGRLIRTFEGHDASVTSVAVSSDGRYVVSGDLFGTVRAWDARTGSPLSITEPIKEHLPRKSITEALQGLKKNPPISFKTGDVFPRQSVAISWDGRRSLSGSLASGTLVLRDTFTGRVIAEFKEHSAGVRSVALSPDSRLALSGSDDHTARLWDASTGRLLAVLEGHTAPVNAVALSRDGRKALTGSDDHLVKLWDVSSGSAKLVRTFSGHTGSVLSVDFAPDGRHFLTGGDDHTMKLWDTETGDQVSFANGKGEWIAFTPDGYFDGSRRCSELVAAVKEDEAFAIDQIATAKNRPDVVLKRMGVRDESTIDYYYSLYRRRLKRQGYNESEMENNYSVPLASIVVTKRDGKNVEVTFRLQEPKYHLKSYNIYVNDVPIFGSYGKNISGNSIDRTERIALTTGSNKIEVTCTNDAGGESYRAITYADYQTVERGDLYYLGFGASKYHDESLDLRYASKDAKDLEAAFLKMAGTYFDAVHVRTFLDEQVTIANIVKAKEFVSKAKVDDTFVLFIAGHGVHAADEGATYYYLMYDTELGRLQSTAASFDLIEDLLQGIPPRKKLFLMDTCESGEAEDGSSPAYSFIANDLAGSARTSRGIRIVRKDSGMDRQKLYLSDKDRFIQNDLLRRSGAVVFSSSQGDEFSYESDDLKNGFFTAAVLAGLSAGDRDGDGIISTDELTSYVAEVVPNRTGDRQHPTVDRDNIFQRFGFPVARRY